jgi:hypothetical protein
MQVHGLSRLRAHRRSDLMDELTIFYLRSMNQLTALLTAPKSES